MFSLSTDQQIDGFTFMEIPNRDLRMIISTVGDRAKCLKFKEELKQAQVGIHWT